MSHRSRTALLLTFLVVATVVAAGTVLKGPELLSRFTHPLYQEGVIARAAAHETSDPYLIAAMINVESGFRANVRSSAGAVGLMQVLPSTAKAVAKHLGIQGKMTESALKDPETNIRVGTAYYASLFMRYNGDDRLALAAYNAGISNADRWARKWGTGMSDTDAVKLIDFPETVNYIGEVLAQRDVYRSLYPGVFTSATR